VVESRAAPDRCPRSLRTTLGRSWPLSCARAPHEINMRFGKRCLEWLLLGASACSTSQPDECPAPAAMIRVTDARKAVQVALDSLDIARRLAVLQRLSRAPMEATDDGVGPADLIPMPLVEVIPHACVLDDIACTPVLLTSDLQPHVDSLLPSAERRVLIEVMATSADDLEIAAFEFSWGSRAPIESRVRLRRVDGAWISERVWHGPAHVDQ